MIISDTKKMIVFQPWKCASSTLHLRLGQYDNKKYPQDVYYNEILKKISHKHILMEDFFKLPESSLNYSRICFVRNPYDRMYAGYLQLKQQIKNNRRMPDFKGKQYVESSFSSYLSDYIVPTYEKTGQVWGGFLHEYVYFKNQKQIDFVGYVERFENDFKKIFNQFKVACNQDMANVKNKPKQSCDPHNMKIADYKYLKKYTSDELQIVNFIFAKDFELFNYQTKNKTDLS